MTTTANAGLTALTKTIRRHLVDMMGYSKSSHIGTCLSTVETLAVLYFRILKLDPKNPTDPERDRFILSKAHGSGALYATLAERGFFDRALLKRYYVDGGVLPGHLDREAVPGVETSGGSLGHGLSLGVGMALANRYDRNPGRVYVLCGDGEMNEGSCWEAIMMGAQLKLSNLTLLVDYNKIQSLGRTDDIIDQRNMAQRLEAFGWETIELPNGHDLVAIEAALVRPVASKPRAVILHTVKGKGVSFMEDKLLWHYRSPTEEEAKRAYEEIDS